MSDKPILLSGPMVRALLDGRKTQTRRILKPQPDMAKISQPCHPEPRGNGRWVWMACDDRPGYSFATADFKVRFEKGDRLYVRETWQGFNETRGAVIAYKATCDGDSFDFAAEDGAVQRLTVKKWRPGIHMPRWASRLTLTVTDVRVQRLQEISPEDARDEGVDRRSKSVRQFWLFGATAEEREAIYLRACVWEYEQLWNDINGAGSWTANPWIVALTFTVEQRNIGAAA